MSHGAMVATSGAPSSHSKVGAAGHQQRSARPNEFTFAAALGLFRLLFSGRFLSPQISIAMFILDLLFVFAELLLQLLDGYVDRSPQATRLVVRREIVLVLCRYLDVDAGIVGLLQVDNHLNRRQSFENATELLNLRAELFPCRFAEMSVPR